MIYRSGYIAKEDRGARERQRYGSGMRRGGSSATEGDVLYCGEGCTRGVRYFGIRVSLEFGLALDRIQQTVMVDCCVRTLVWLRQFRISKREDHDSQLGSLEEERERGYVYYITRM